MDSFVLVINSVLVVHMFFFFKYLGYIKALP